MTAWLKKMPKKARNIATPHGGHAYPDQDDVAIHCGRSQPSALWLDETPSENVERSQDSPPNRRERREKVRSSASLSPDTSERRRLKKLKPSDEDLQEASWRWDSDKSQALEFERPPTLHSSQTGHRFKRLRQTSTTCSDSDAENEIHQTTTAQLASGAGGPKRGRPRVQSLTMDVEGLVPPARVDPPALASSDGRPIASCALAASSVLPTFADEASRPSVLATTVHGSSEAANFSPRCKDIDCEQDAIHWSPTRRNRRVWLCATDGQAESDGALCTDETELPLRKLESPEPPLNRLRRSRGNSDAHSIASTVDDCPSSPSLLPKEMEDHPDRELAEVETENAGAVVLPHVIDGISSPFPAETVARELIVDVDDQSENVDNQNVLDETLSRYEDSGTNHVTSSMVGRSVLKDSQQEVTLGTGVAQSEIALPTTHAVDDGPNHHQSPGRSHQRICPATGNAGPVKDTKQEAVGQTNTNARSSQSEENDSPCLSKPELQDGGRKKMKFELKRLGSRVRPCWPRSLSPDRQSNLLGLQSVSDGTQNLSEGTTVFSFDSSSDVSHTLTVPGGHKKSLHLDFEDIVEEVPCSSSSLGSSSSSSSSSSHETQRQEPSRPAHSGERCCFRPGSIYDWFASKSGYSSSSRHKSDEQVERAVKRSKTSTQSTSIDNSIDLTSDVQGQSSAAASVAAAPAVDAAAANSASAVASASAAPTSTHAEPRRKRRLPPSVVAVEEAEEAAVAPSVLARAAGYASAVYNSVSAPSERSGNAERRRRRDPSLIMMEPTGRYRAGSGSDPARNAGAMSSDELLAMSLQMEEAEIMQHRPMYIGNAGDRQRNVFHDHAEDQGPQYFYVVQACTGNVQCRGCSQRISSGNMRVMFQREGQRQLHSAHMACLANLEGLVRPAASSVHLAAHLSQEDRDAAETYLATLPDSAAATCRVQRFTWPPVPREPIVMRNSAGSGGRGELENLRRRLMNTDRDFTPEDYEMLGQLDELQRNSNPGRDEAEATLMLEGLMQQLPKSTVQAGASVVQCCICMDDMEVGQEVRTLPCLHKFHTACIDRWLKDPAGPRCPIDQAPIEFWPAE